MAAASMTQERGLGEEETIDQDGEKFATGQAGCDVLPHEAQKLKESVDFLGLKFIGTKDLDTTQSFFAGQALLGTSMRK